jgi:putative transposase
MKKHIVEQIINKLRQAEVELGQGRRMGEVCRSLGVTEQTYYRWRKEYGGLKMNQAKRLNELEQKNTQLRKAVPDLTLDKLMLKEAAQENS